MAGKEKWTDPKVKAVFETWKELLPVLPGRRGRPDLAGRRPGARPEEGRHVPARACSCRSSSRRPAQADLDDLDFFPYPELRDRSTTPRRRSTRRSTGSCSAQLADPGRRHRRGQGVPRVPRPAGDAGRLGHARTRATSRPPRTPTRAATRALQKKAAELIGGAQRITQFLDRDTNPNFAGPNGMQAFLLDFLKNPNQDLAAFHEEDPGLLGHPVAVERPRPG